MNPTDIPQPLQILCQGLKPLPSPVIVTDQTGTILYLNQACINLLTPFPVMSLIQNPTKFAEKNITTLITEPFFKQHWKTSVEEKVSIDFTFSLQNSNKQTVPLDCGIHWIHFDEQLFATIYFKDSTEHFIHQEHRDAHQTRLERALSGTSDGIWDWNFLTRKLWFSSRFKALLNYSEKDFDASFKSFEEHIHPDDLDQFTQALDEHLENHLPFDIEYRLRSADSSWIWFRARGQAIWDVDGEPILMSGSIMDISLQKQAFNQIEKYTQSLEQLHHITTVTNLDFDEKLEFLLDLGTRVFDLEIGLISHINGDDYTIACSIGNDAPPPKTVLNFQDTYCSQTVKLNCPIGYNQAKKSDIESHPCYKKLRHESYIGTPIYVNHRLLGTLCFVSFQSKPDPFVKTDYSLIQLFAEWIGNELAAAETNTLLTKSNAQQKAILDNAPIAIIYTNPNGIITSFNKGAEILLGYQAAQVVNTQSPEIFFDIGPEYTQRKSNTSEKVKFSYLAEQVINQSSDQQEWICRKADQTSFIAEVSITEIKDDKQRNNGYLILASDMTHRKHTEQLLIEAKEQAEQNDKMKSEFINMMSHELRTPLTVILGYLPLLQNQELSLSTKETREIALEMQNSGDHLLQLINDLLDLSKIEAGKMSLQIEQFDLQGLLVEVVETFKIRAKEKSICLECSCPTVFIQADKVRIKQILFNLIGNALKFTESGKIQVIGTLKNGKVTVKVIDTGIGINDKELPHIFERFKQAGEASKNTIAGTGLGLAITEQLVKLHRGKIGVSSKLNHGTTFYFELPFVE